MQDLIKEYQEAVKWLEQAKVTVEEEDKVMISRMISDLKYGLEWMQTGRRPGNKRGIERRAAYQREQPLDPLWMQAYVANTSTSHCGISAQERERIDEALKMLTAREKEVYLLVRGEAYSRNEAARLLGVKKGTVNNILKRCDEKIKVRKATAFFHAPLAN